MVNSALIPKFAFSFILLYCHARERWLQLFRNDFAQEIQLEGVISTYLSRLKSSHILYTTESFIKGAWFLYSIIGRQKQRVILLILFQSISLWILDNKVLDFDFFPRRVYKNEI